MILVRRFILTGKNYSTSTSTKIINEKAFETDSFTNVTPKIISCISRKIYNQRGHPLCLLKQRIIDFFYGRFKGRRGNPIFSTYDDLNQIVSTQQNFDSLLVPEDHPSRSKSDCYYINRDWLLRSHMTAHQSELLKMGLNNFLVVGDVYRRDEVNATHFPVFHQLDGVRLLTPEELFIENDDGVIDLEIRDKENQHRTKEKQEVYTLTASRMVEEELKKTLEDLSKDLFGDKVKYKWVESYFPFTHPSWELEVLVNEQWVEMLGCGIMEHAILDRAGCSNRIGWAFGLGLERLAMLYYSISDIRIFWSTDPGFLHQFEGKTPADKVTYRPVSQYPACPFDLSFWLEEEEFDSNDLYEWARDGWGEAIEQIQHIDTYRCKKTGRQSRCYRIVYRSMEKTFTKKEVQEIHADLVAKLVDKFKVKIR